MDTTNVVPLHEGQMTAQDFRKFRDAFEDETNTLITLSLGRSSTEPPLVLTIHPKAGASVQASGSNFEEAVANIRMKWAEHRETFRLAIVRKIALAVIECVDENPEHICTDAGLRARGIEQIDIDQYGAEACAKAAEMAGRTPFEILRLAKSNAA